MRPHEFGFASDSNVFDPRRTPENTKPAKECLYKFKFSISQKECTEQKILLDSTPVDFLSVNQLMEGQKNGKPSFVYAASASYTSEGAPPFVRVGYVACWYIVFFLPTENPVSSQRLPRGPPN